MSPSDRFAAIWDMDGTLVDTAELHFNAWMRLANELGRPFSRADFTATFGRRNPEILTFLFDSSFDEKQQADLADRKEDYYRTEAAKRVDLLPGVRSLLEGLAQAGFKQAIGSSAPRANLDLITRLTETEKFFETVVASEDTQRGKPDPQVFQIAADRLKVPYASAVVFEDAVAGVQAAKAGGMKCVAVTFVGHHSEESLRKAGADLVVRNLDEVSLDQVRKLLGIS